MADLKLDILAKADVSSLRQMAETLKDSADVSDDFKRSVDDALAKAEDGARLTNVEFKKLRDTFDRRYDLNGDAEQTLRDIQDSARKAGVELDGKVVDGLERIARSKAPDRIDELDDALRKIDGEDIDIDVDIDKTGRGRKKMDSFRDDLKSSANQSGQEIAGTFTNGFDAESIADGFTEILGESTENLSGKFQALGLAGAAAFAIAYGELAKMAEKINTAKTEAGELANEWGEIGSDTEMIEHLQGKFDELSTTLADVRSWFEVWQTDAVSNIEAISGAMEAGTLDAEAFGQAFFETDPTVRLEKLRDVQADLNKKLEEGGQLDWWEQMLTGAAAVEGSTRAHEALADAQSEGIQLSESARDALSKMIKTQEDAVGAEEAAAAASGLTVEAYRETQKQAGFLAEALADDLTPEQINNEVAARNAADAQREFADATGDAMGSSLDAADAVRELMKSFDENGASLDVTTKKGRNNTRAMLDSADAAKRAADAELELTGSQAAANRKLEEGAEAAYAAATAKGVDKRAASDLISEIYGIPKSRFTDVDVDDKGRIKNVQNEINDIHGKSVDINVNANTYAAETALARVRNMVNEVDGRSITIPVGYKRTGGPTP